MATSHFQFALRTVVDSWAGARSLLPQQVKGLGGRRAVLFADPGLTRAGITKTITELFMRPQDEVQLAGVFGGIEQDAKADSINRGPNFSESAELIRSSLSAEAACWAPLTYKYKSRR